MFIKRFYEPETGFNFVTCDFKKKRLSCFSLKLLPDEEFGFLPYCMHEVRNGRKVVVYDWLCFRWCSYPIGKLKPVGKGKADVTDRNGRKYRFVGMMDKRKTRQQIGTVEGEIHAPKEFDTWNAEVSALFETGGDKKAYGK